MPEVSIQAWEDFYNSKPQAHIMQSPHWGELKAGQIWTPIRLVNGDSGAQMLIRRLPLGYTMAYIPKGPIGEDWDSLWPEIDSICRANKVVFLKIEPDCWTENEPDLHDQKFKQSKQNIQPRRTIVIDISKEEQEVLAAMKQKTRYNIRLAGRKDIVVKQSTDMQAFYDLMKVTGERDGFGVHPLEYYQKAYDLFHNAGMGELLIAEFGGQALAGLLMLFKGERAWYLYGASNNQHREKMPTYRLQWEAIRLAKKQGCTEYDLWGVPDYDEEILEAQFLERKDELWSVYRFKRGFGGQVKQFSIAWDRIYKPLPYLAYLLIVSMQFLKNSFYRIRRLGMS